MTRLDNAAIDGSITKEAFVGRARELGPVFRQRAQAAEELRRLPTESVAALMDMGITRMLAPRRFGGYELGLDAWFDVVLEVGKADASHAWCAGLLISFPHWVAFFPDEAQEAVWAGGPDVAIAGSIPPVCTVTPDTGGYRISGKASFVSGVGHSAWVMVSGLLHGEGAPQWCFFLIPPGGYEVEDTWFTVGMRATGSNTVVVDGVFVPETHMLRLSDFREGRAPGSSVNDRPLYRLPWASYAPLTFVGTMLGAAQGAYEGFRDWTRTRLTAGGASVADFTTVQVRMATVAADIDAAELLVRRAIAETQQPAPPSLTVRTRSFRDFARAAQLAVGGVDTLLAMSGTSGFAETHALQRAWRDVHFAASHVSLNFDANGANWARAELGLERLPTQQIF